MKSTKSKIVAWIFIVASFLGFLDASYLSIKEFFVSPINCFIVKGCDIVANSSYARLFGTVPLAFFGVIFYLAVFFVSVRYLEMQKAHLFKTVFLFSCVGVLFDIYLLYIQIFVLRAFCIYCLTSAALSISIFVVSLFAYEELKD